MAGFRLTLLTADPGLAAAAVAAGVDRIGVDVERRGKAARQRDGEGRLSGHRLGDLAALRGVVPPGRRFARIDPPHPGLEEQIDAAIAAGADHLMLPFFHQVEAVARFVRAIDGRARPIALVETRAALDAAGEVAGVPGLAEVMFGLNDLHRELGLPHHFAVLASARLARAADAVRAAGLPLSVGGVAPPGMRGLPVDPALVLAQYPRLGATGAWLSRSFVASAGAAGLADGVAAIRAAVSAADPCPAAQESARQALARAVLSLPGRPASVPGPS